MTIHHQSSDGKKADPAPPSWREAASFLARSVQAVLPSCLMLLAALQPRYAVAASLVEGPTVEVSSATNAIVRWSTDVATGARVRYGTSISQLTQSAQGEVGGKHSVTLTGLRPGSKYFYTIGTARLPLATNFFFMPGRMDARARTPEIEPVPKSSEVPVAATRRAPPARETWGEIRSLGDHFDRHGGDFKAKDADDYARQAWEFLQRARAEGLPTKVDKDGVIRIFDPKTRTFAAYNRDGTTKTFFKPNSRDYFDRQPGQPTSPKTLKF